MPIFSEKSKERLASCHKDLQAIFNEIIKYFDCTISEGHRGKQAQDKAYVEGYSKIKFPNGKHNKFPSMAVDVYPYPVDLNPKSAREKEVYRIRMGYFAGHVMNEARKLKEEGRITHDLTWGGDWNRDTEIKDHSFLDFPHFELS